MTRKSTLDPNSFIDMADAFKAQKLKGYVRLLYANGTDPLNPFAEAIYRPDARLWLHPDMAAITLLAATRAEKDRGVRFVLTDGLRTTTAQARMAHTAIARANPHWTEDGPNRLLSPPGAGAHPRGMAIDIYLEDLGGTILDMGTVIDHLSDNPSHNPAARSYLGLTPAQKNNRDVLENLMVQAAIDMGLPLLPLPAEWWDFRLPPSIYDAYAPLSDDDLPDFMRLCGM